LQIALPSLLLLYILDETVKKGEQSAIKG